MVQDRKVAQLRDRARGGIGRRIMKNQKHTNTISKSVTASMFPAYERVVLREGNHHPYYTDSVARLLAHYIPTQDYGTAVFWGKSPPYSVHLAFYCLLFFFYLSLLISFGFTFPKAAKVGNDPKVCVERKPREIL